MNRNHRLQILLLPRHQVGMGKRRREEVVTTASDEFLKASMETFGGKIISKPKEN